MSFPFLQPYAGLGNSLQTAQAAGGAGGAVGGWVELGRTTLGSDGDSIDVTGLADKRYYMVLGDFRSSGNTIPSVRFNSDTGTNYARRQSNNGGADATATSTNLISWGSTDSAANQKFGFGYLVNLPSKEKLWIAQMGESGSTGAANATNRREVVAKWANTSNSISSVNIINQSSGDYVSGSECVVLGWDPADTHTSNFWEELASVELGTTADSFDTGTFTAKKYLWVQVFTKGSGAVRAGVRLGNSTIDTGANYAIKRSHNGAADETFTNGTFGVMTTSGAPSNDNEFINMFIINNASNEKLAISHYSRKNTSGAANAPNRGEIVGKWANTSNQCNIIQAHNDQSGDFVSGSIIKVWGAD